MSNPIAVTVNLTVREKQAAEDLALRLDLTEESILRQGLRLYQMERHRAEMGHARFWKDADGNEVKEHAHGCPDLRE